MIVAAVSAGALALVYRATDERRKQVLEEELRTAIE